MTDDPFSSVFVPVLVELRGVLESLVVIGGWVPELHRRFGGSAHWAVKPLGTTEVDVLLDVRNGEVGDHRALAEALALAGFAPVMSDGPCAIWERTPEAGERIEFFVDHAGPWRGLSTVRAIDPDSRLGAFSLSDLGVLREYSSVLTVPLEKADGTVAMAPLRVPELGAFLIHKGATFRRRPDVSKEVKDVHYIVDVMQSGDTVVEEVAGQIQEYCSKRESAAELTRSARNNLSVLLGENANTELRKGLAEGLSIRHGISEAEADARVRGYLEDFVGLIPELCGGLRE